jgi:hypothetical protein
MSCNKRFMAALLVCAALFGDCKAETNRNTPLSPIPAPLRTIRVNPSISYCPLLKGALAGDEYVFAAGTYSEPCHFSASGTSAAPIVIRSADPSNRARFSYSGVPSNFFEIAGSFVVIRDLAFQDNSADIMIRLYNNRSVVIDNNVFDRIDGQAITANSGSTTDLVIRRNTFRDITKTIVYLGCHAGDCASTAFLVERNFMDASAIEDPSVTGYGIQVKLNSHGTLRDNSIFNAQGPDIMVYGNQNPNAPANIITGNFLVRSRKDAALNVAGGPARVFNNVLINADGPALYAQDYGARGLQKNVTIFGNTLISATNVGIQVEGWGSARQGNVIAGNAILAATPLSPNNLAGTVTGNILCGASDCFTGSATQSPYFLTPSPTGKLASSVAGFTPPACDFFGLPRLTNSPGAIVGSEQTRRLPLADLKARPARLKPCYN